MKKQGQPHLHRYGELWAFIAGIILPLAFSPFGLYSLAIFSPALLLTVWLKSSPARAFFRGWLFGLGFFGFGISWVYVSIHKYGQAPAALAIIGTILLIAFLALFFALQGYLLNRFFPKNNLSKCVLAFPALWVIFEWIRTWFMTGFPWILIGYSQITSPLRGFAPIVSVYGVSLATVMTAGILTGIIFVKKRKHYTLLVFFTVIIIWIGGFLLTRIHWTKPIGNPVTVTLIQGNVPQEMKWSPSELQQSLLRYKKLTQPHWKSDIIIWPEAAITLPKTEAQPFLDQLSAEAKANNTTIITGIPIDEGEKYYNGMIAIGNGQGVYYKRHLVPFGEFMPFRFMLNWLKDFVLIPMSDLSAGPSKQPEFIVSNIIIAPFICYEIIFPKEVLNEFPKAQMMIVISDNSWFGRSFAPAQQLQMTQMRALETGRYVLAATNDGVTAIIAPTGQLAEFADPFVVTTLTGKAQAMTGKTPLMMIGIWPVIALLFILLFIGWFYTRHE